MMLDLIHEINLLWNPVYPYLANHIYELYGCQDGRILEIGPFAGVIFDLQRKSIGNSFLIATFPPGMAKFFLQEAKKQNVEEKVDVLETDPFLTGVGEESVDLAIFRGAFFFPSLFEVNLPRIHQVLRPNGMAFIGGGFGKFTPDTVIQDIGKRSRDLNLKLGKIEVKENKLREDIRALHIKGKVDVITKGGLWVLMKKV
ncbi:MAG: hypothetical protein WCO26_00070 [Deltaproteobacteria bacterium]